MNTLRFNIVPARGFDHARADLDEGTLVVVRDALDMVTGRTDRQIAACTRVRDAIDRALCEARRYEAAKERAKAHRRPETFSHTIPISEATANALLGSNA